MIESSEHKYVFAPDLKRLRKCFPQELKMLSILSSRCCPLQSKCPLTLYLVSINTFGHQQCL